jgi:hypothetical protein
MANMTIPRIKATYSLDAETVAVLERLARRWDVSKSEALRRVIRASASAERVVDDEPSLAALSRAQRAANLTAATAAAWARHARAERRAAGTRRGR